MSDVGQKNVVRHHDSLTLLPASHVRIGNRNLTAVDNKGLSGGLAYGAGRLSTITIGANAWLERNGMPATGDGGALFLQQATLFIGPNFTAIANGAVRGGVIFSTTKSNITLVGPARLLDNVAISSGGAISSNDDYSLFLGEAILLRNCSVSAGDGGGVFVSAATNFTMMGYVSSDASCIVMCDAKTTSINLYYTNDICVCAQRPYQSGAEGRVMCC